MENIKYEQIQNDEGKLVSYMAVEVKEILGRRIEMPIATIGLFGYVELFSRVTLEQFADIKKFAKLVKGE